MQAIKNGGLIGNWYALYACIENARLTVDGSVRIFGIMRYDKKSHRPKSGLKYPLWAYEAADRNGIKIKTFTSRMRNGWNINDACTKQAREKMQTYRPPTGKRKKAD